MTRLVFDWFYKMHFFSMGISTAHISLFSTFTNCVFFEYRQKLDFQSCFGAKSLSSNGTNATAIIVTEYLSFLSPQFRLFAPAWRNNCKCISFFLAISGSTPYPGLTAREVMRQVTEGYRLERPDHCKPELYRLFSTCWQQDLNKRPTFHQLKIELSTLLEHQTGYIDLENFPEEDYFSMHQNNEEKL